MPAQRSDANPMSIDPAPPPVPHGDSLANDGRESLVGAKLRADLARAWKITLAKNATTATAAIHELALSQVEKDGGLSPSQIAAIRAEFVHGRRLPTRRIPEKGRG
jgi:hypothetical protein